MSDKHTFLRSFFFPGSVLMILMILSVHYLLFVTYRGGSLAEWETEIFAIMLIVAGAISAASGRFPKNFSEKDIALTVSFGVLLYVAQFLTAYVPAFVYYVPPFSYFIDELIIYFPEGIIFAAMLAMVKKSGSAFSMMVPFFILSMITFFNPIWTTFYFGWAGAVEITIWLSRENITPFRASMMAFIFGLTDASLVSIFSLFNFGVYTPPFVSVYSSIFYGVACGIGGLIGYRVGISGKSVWKP